MVPTIQGYEDAGDFTVKARLRTSIHGNLVFYLCLGSVALIGLILLIALHNDWFASFCPLDLLLLFIDLLESLNVIPSFASWSLILQLTLLLSSTLLAQCHCKLTYPI